MSNRPPTTPDAVIQKLITIRVLTSHFEKAITAPGPSAIKASETTPHTNPLSDLRDAVSVYKAQTTKLGLLLVNKPLTPSAIYTILDDLEKRVFPSLCGSATYIYSKKNLFGDLFVADLVCAVQEVLGSAGPLAETIEHVVTNFSKSNKNHVMLVVGKVYSASDALIALADKSVPGLLMKKVKEWTALMEDALEELRDWSEDMDDDACEDGDSGDDDVASEEERKETLEELMAGMNIGDSKRLPGHRKDLIDLLTEALRRVDLVIKLCNATSKRRVKKYSFQSPPFSSEQVEDAKAKEIAALNSLVLSVEQLQGDVDELAGAFYELNASLIRHFLSKISEEAEDVAKRVSLDWDRKEDDFTTWTSTWTKLINKNEVPSDTRIS
jgi:Grap2 and cyclin-D-interacting protein